MNLGKIPPQSIDIEEAVLGAVMLEKNAIIEIANILTPEMFYKESHIKIFESVISLFKTGNVIDVLTVTNNLRKKNDLDFCGGPFYITTLTERVHSSSHIIEHSLIIKENYIKRKLIELGNEIINKSYDNSTDFHEILDKSSLELINLSGGFLKSNLRHIKYITNECLDNMSKNLNNENGIKGLPTGSIELDKYLYGWQKSDLIILAARPGMGKTSFAVQSGINSAKHNKTVCIFSLEMSANQLVERIISNEFEVPLSEIKSGKINNYNLEVISNKIHKITDLPVYIDDTPGLSILELRSKALKMKMKFGVDLIVVDYIQLMSDSTIKNGNREQEISRISRGLKNLAKELDIPIIALSQLSRAVETRGGDKKPILSDLRESGSIEQDADIVLFIYRPEYYGILKDMDGNSLEGISFIMIAKHRNGSLEDVGMRFIGNFTKFKDLEVLNIDSNDIFK